MIDREADLPLTGFSIIQIQNAGNNQRATGQEIADLTGLVGTEVVRVRRGKRWAKTTVADIAGGINGSDIVTIKQGKRHVRTTAQSIADLGGAYEGPLDLVAGAVVAYSVARALSTAWIGQNVVRLRRDGGSPATLDFVAGADGSVSVAAVTAWLDGANGFVDTLYDQSGNGADLSQADTAKQPPWLANFANSRPGLSLGDPVSLERTYDFTGGAQTLFVVGKIANTNAFASFLGIVGGALEFGTFYNIGGDLYFTVNPGDAATWATDETMTAAAAHVLEWVIAADGTPTTRVDGTQLTTNLASGILTAIPTTMGAIFRAPQSGTDASQGEVILYNAALSGGNCSLVRADQAAYYGT